MSSLQRRFSLFLLLILLAAMLPAVQPVFAQELVVDSSADTDDGASTCGSGTCTLRKAIRLANSTPGPNTITFAPGVVTIQPQTTSLPAITDNDTTIDGGSSRVTISGTVLAANGANGHGLIIRSNNNTIRSLVIIGFPRGGATETSGAGIYIDGGDNNRVYNCYLGIEADGNTARGNGRYGVFIANGANNNIIGGTGANERNVIAGNAVANVAIANAGTSELNQNNQIVGNYIGTNAEGTAPPSNVDTTETEAGISVSIGARGTLIADNLVGGHTSTSPVNQIIAGITVSSYETTFNSALTPRDTTIVRNLIGVNSNGNVIPNRVGILIGAVPNPNYGPYNTVIGDPLDPVGGRNVIAGNAQRGIEITDSTAKFGNVTIAGNYIGLNASGAPSPNGTQSLGRGEGIWVGLYNPNATGTNPVVTIGPANVISGNVFFGIRFRSGGHVVRGNFIGTNTDGSSSQIAAPRTANGAASIWIENGNGITIGGPNLADRNVIAWSNSLAGGVGAGILINPEASGTLNNCSPTCATGGHTIQNNFIGVRRDGTAALNPNVGERLSREGIRIRRSSGNSIRGNVIAGSTWGITVGQADNNVIEANRIGTRANGSLIPGERIGNNQDGIWLISGSGNIVRENLLAFNGSDSFGFGVDYHGIRVDAGAVNSQILTNHLFRNGGGDPGDGVRVNGATGVRISRTTTSQNDGDGISLNSGGNGNQAPPSLSGVSAGPPPTLTGTACPNCTVEVFTSSTREDREGPLFLTSGTADGSGNFSISIPGCLRYLTATAIASNGNTSPFTNAFDTGATGPCTATPTFSLSEASPSSRNVNIGSSTIFTHTLTHNAPVERTYIIQITSSLGWASGPALVTVPAAPAGGQSSVEFGVTVGVPLGTSPNTTHSVTVRAVFGAATSNQVTDTVTAVQPELQPATPSVSPGQTLPLSGASVTFTHTVTNIGNLPGVFEVVDPAFVGTPPTGWNIAPPVLNPTTIPAGGTATLTIVVNTPGSTPPPGEVRIRFRVGVTGTERRSDPVENVITIPVVRGFTFLPTDDPLIVRAPAGADVFFNYTLTNTGNAADSFTVTPTLPSGSPLEVYGVNATPSLTSLAAGASSNVRVTIRIPTGTTQGPYDFTVTAAASGGTNPPVPITRNARVVVLSGGAARIAPGTGTPDPVNVRTAPGTVTFTNTVTNTGNAAVPIRVPTTFSGPPGWTVTTTATTCNTTVNPGNTCTFTVTVTVPQGADAGAYPIEISATADNTGLPDDPPSVTALATITVNVQRFREVELAPNRESEGAPNQVLTFTHTLTNTGNAPDSFDLSASASEPGWTIAISPTTVLDVPRNGTRTITVQVTVPLGVRAGNAITVTVTATGREGGPSVSATNVVRIASITAADLSPGRTGRLDAGETVVYTHTLTNTGTTTTAFLVESSDSLPGWSSTVTGSPTALLEPGQQATITVQVTAPPTAQRGDRNTTTLRVRAVGEGTPVLDQETNISQVGPARGVIIEPDRSGDGPPNSLVAFTHTVRNIGVEQSAFQLTVAEANGWPATVAPDLVNLGPGQEIEVTVRIFIPAGKRAGDPGFARVRAELVGDPRIADDAVINLTVRRTAGVELTAAQVRAVRANGQPQRLSSLTVINRGSAADTFDLAPLDLPSGWRLTLTPSTVTVDRDGTFRVAVEVTPPEGLAPGTVITFFVEVRSRFDNTVRARVPITLVIPETAPQREEPPPGNQPTPSQPVQRRVYLPLVRP